jgi:hypothetical protein
MDIVDMAIHQVVFQKCDFHGNSDFQNSQKLAFTNNGKKLDQNILTLFGLFGSADVLFSKQIIDPPLPLPLELPYLQYPLSVPYP